MIGRALRIGTQSRDHKELPASAKEAFYLSSLSRRSYSLLLVYSSLLHLAFWRLESFSPTQDQEEKHMHIFLLVLSRLVSSQRNVL